MNFPRRNVACNVSTKVLSVIPKLIFQDLTLWSARFQTGTVAQVMASSYSGIHHISHTKHHGASVLWERAEYSEGIRITLC